MKIGSRLLCCTAAFASVAGFSGTAQAAIDTVSTTGLKTPLITYTTNAAVAAGLTGGSYTGVGSLFVSYASTATTGFGALCTGALVSTNSVLTAGHCLSDYNEEGDYDPVTGVTFYLPSRGERTPENTFTAVSWEVNSGFSFETLNDDIAVFALGKEALGYDIYDIYEGDPLKQFTRVGTGTVGGPAGTGTDGSASDYKQRSGENLFEYYGDEVFTDVGHNVLMSDFDDGTTTHDAFGRAGGNLQTGITDESSSSPGDSGGPSFIDGKIVSVTSFGITGGVFQGFCGGNGAIDPYHYNAAGTAVVTTRTTNLGLCTNSSIGEMNGDTWVLPYKDFVMDFASEHALPEPATWAMMIAGFGMVGGSLRLRRRDGKAALAA